ncbi:hypothetical protein [Pedobacter sp. WC2423]|uniref:hypothetical protein n=1 Tax=Pedobacter sp. WC2423 TaxID=3234142 RepID=UPI00346559BE
MLSVLVRIFNGGKKLTLQNHIFKISDSARMNLRFQTNKLVNFDQNTVVEKAMSFLQKENYNIIEKTGSFVLFNDDDGSSRLISNFAYQRKVNKGRLEFSENNKNTDVCLTYYLSITIELIQWFIIIIISVFVDYHAIFALILFVLIFLFKIKNIQDNFIGNMIGSQDNDI